MKLTEDIKRPNLLLGIAAAFNISDGLRNHIALSDDPIDISQTGKNWERRDYIGRKNGCIFRRDHFPVS